MSNQGLEREGGEVVRSPWTAVLLVVALAQSLAACWLLLPADTGFAMLPYFRDASWEGDWQSLDRLVRARLAAGPVGREVATSLARGVAAQDQAYRLRNRTHHFNIEACLVGTRMLRLLTPRERAAVMGDVGHRASSDDPLQALDQALGR